MTTRISTQLSALALALIMNGAVLGGVAYLFSSPSAQAAAVAQVAVAPAGDAKTAGAPVAGARANASAAV
jgi:hypothetical protein